MKITHDFHVHTNLSICAKPEATLENYVERWRENGITKVAITDHMWDHGATPIENDFYEKQDVAHILELRDKVEEYRKSGMDILFGTECEYSYKTRRPAEAGIALELNPNYVRNRSLETVYDEPYFRMFRIGKECGCKFTVGSDAHAMTDYDNYNRIYTLTSLLDLKKDDFHPKTI